MDDERLSFESGQALIRSLLREGRPALARAMAVNLAATLASLTGPWALYAFVKRLSDGAQTTEGLSWALAFAALLGASGFVSGLLTQHYYYRMLICYQTFTNVLNRALFKRALRLTAAARARSPVGDIVNHMSSDSDSLAELASIMGDALISAVTVVGATASLFWLLGPASLVSIASLLMLAPLTRRVARDFSRLEKEMLEHRDRRVTLMSQALGAIRLVKYYVWEKSVERETQAVRAAELSARRRLAWAETIATLGYVATSTLILFAALGVYVALGGHLTPATTFAAVALFGALEEPVGNVSRIVSRWMNAVVGADRIVRFMGLPALPSEIGRGAGPAAGPPAIEIENLVVRHDAQAEPALRGLSLSVRPGEAIALVGPVGAGKTTLISALLGELAAESGSIRFSRGAGDGLPDNLHGGLHGDLHSAGARSCARPRTAYVPQEAYIVNGTLRENVLFGVDDGTASALDARVRRAIELACLESDVARLPGGLEAEIGERGVNLSGGQKQRVSLARSALYGPDLAMLDDPLSAVDSDTEGKICDRLLFGEWATVTRLAATHRLSHLARFDRVAYLENGRLVACAPFAELLVSCDQFRAFFAEHARSEGGAIRDEEGAAPKPAPAGRAAFESSRAPAPGPETRITEEEDREIGAVKGSIYLQYVRALGGRDARFRPWRLGALASGTLLVILIPLGQRAWLALSSNAQAGLASEGAPQAGVRRWMANAFRATGWDAWAASPSASVFVYGGLCAAALLAVFFNRVYWLDRGIGAGRDMHDRMLRSTLETGLRFFDSTPAGRVLQRFSRDLEAVDIQLQWSFEATVRCVAHVVAALALIAIALPATLLAIGPTLWIYYRVQDAYRRPAREAKRLDSISRSPRYAHFKETLQGLSAIRAFGRADWFMEQFCDRLERNQRMFRGHYLLNRWFSSRIPLLGAAISFATGAGLALAASQGSVSAGAAGLVATYAIGLWDYLNWGVRIFAEVEARMTSVERIDRYSRLEPEQDVLRPAVGPLPAAWPERGEIRFEQAVLRYAPHLPPALKGASFVAPAGSRVGLIGRTGSGKSTIFQALFRCAELESGRICIDGADIASVPLARLRRSIAIIPQDPILFMGTVRDNLDRYHERSDDEVWHALALARMREAVQRLPQGLLTEVHENGANFSQGQRQLLCLARALLSRARIVVLDEATASVDVRTDAAVQQVIREACGGMTMLIIAHRLGTVADCDLIVEMADGKAYVTEPSARLGSSLGATLGATLGARDLAKLHSFDVAGSTLKL